MGSDFEAGRLRHFIDEWCLITSDPNILEIVIGCRFNINLSELPVFNTCKQYKFSAKDHEAMSLELGKLEFMKVIERVPFGGCQVISPIFPRPKPNGEIRIILDLTELNLHIPYQHFQMETFEHALTLIRSDMYMASVDLRHAYHSVNIAVDHRKLFCFNWNGVLFRFTCLMNGVCEGPRLFTKLLKPVFAFLRSQGCSCTGYIDDSLICGDTLLDCNDNVRLAVGLFEKLGFIINIEKSALAPARQIQYLGNVIDSERMIVTLPVCRRDAILEAGNVLYGMRAAKIRLVARVVGLIVASFSAVDFGRLHYRWLESAKIRALSRCKGDFDAEMVVTAEMRLELRWWLDNLKDQFRVITRPPASAVVCTDASSHGWGAFFQGCSTGGRWTLSECELHINELELKAILFALKAFQDELLGRHVKVLCDNSTAVCYINEMGGTRSWNCNSVACDIWSWCISKGIWLTCSFIPGVDNVEADEASRVFDDRSEWMLDKGVFDDVCTMLGVPDIDLFASRVTAQTIPYCSWKPDPGAAHVDAFTVDWSVWNLIYLFPPFSLLGRCVRKIREDRAVGLLVAPVWPTQPWFVPLMELLTEAPVVISKKKGLLKWPHQDAEHPLGDKLKIMVCKVSGIRSENVDFLNSLPRSSCRPGSPVRGLSTRSTSGDGFSTVVKGRYLRFSRRWYR